QDEGRRRALHRRLWPILPVRTRRRPGKTRSPTRNIRKGRRLGRLSEKMARVAVDDASASFAELLRDHRRTAGLTQEARAEGAGDSPRGLGELERGGAHARGRDTVALLARALGLAGAERGAFEALVERRRRPRPAGPGRARAPMPPAERGAARPP